MTYALENIWKRYGLTTLALKNINLTIPDEEFLVIYGPAGAGKSSALNILAGIAKPTSGDVLRNGQSIIFVPPEKRNAAMAFENYALYSHLSVFENLAFPLRARHMPDKEVAERVTAMAEMMGIAHVTDRRPGFLSGGQRQRVALARAIIRPADIYLLDEPIGHLDAKLRHRMRAELKALAEDRKSTVVFTTTSSREALALGDRVAVFNAGKLEQVGTPAEIYHRPANTFVATFVGDPPMSLLDVVPQQNGDSVHLTLPGGRSIGEAPASVLGGVIEALQVGFRSREISLVDAGSPQSVSGMVATTEQLGYSVIEVDGIAGQRVSIPTPTDGSLKAGETVGLKFDGSASHVFVNQRAVFHAGGAF
ncbi:MAG: ABC transporter ATP-binding protein [Alphaproteobacteria bacterium]|nr:ABC transporter ATP-binding protein [Alphaproteobacteria bacterium]